MEKTLTITPSRCTSCKTCELACAFRHADASGMGLSRIRTFMYEDGANQIITCFQCDDAACVKVCPVAALVRNESTDAVEVIPNRCIGCGLCVNACPFGHIFLDQRSGVAGKCDLCGDQEPACAAFCPTNTLEYK